MDMYKVIISDFDGTLVGVNYKLSKKLKHAVSEWLRAGKFFSVATGKAFVPMLTNALEELNITSPIIINGGAEIISWRSKEILFSAYITPDIAQAICNLLTQHNYPFVVVKTDKVYSFSKENDLHKEDISFRDLSKLANYHNISKIRITTTDLQEDIVENFVKQEITDVYPTINVVRGYTPSSKGYDITSVNATKQLAMIKLFELLKIDRSEVIGIGDGFNDYSLLTACGYKVALENAPEDLKSIADYIAPSADKDGVADVIYKHI
ncbi:MAG: Cof-type HAD-IIB family hydrolase [Patescibacteria group bacterium]